MLEVLINNDFYLYTKKALSRATREICLMQYQICYRPGRKTNKLNQLIHILASKARAGLKVRVLVNYNSKGHHLNIVNGVAMRYLTKAGCLCRWEASSNLTHTKLILIDRRLCILGSHNLSNSALSRNFEVSCCLLYTSPSPRDRQKSRMPSSA